MAQFQFQKQVEPTIQIPWGRNFCITPNKSTLIKTFSFTSPFLHVIIPINALEHVAFILASTFELFLSFQVHGVQKGY
jgi:hypothetical protein